ncbi:MAG TPA: RNB domain-containing ribonuclease [Polyangia bacterium]
MNTGSKAPTDAANLHLRAREIMREAGFAPEFSSAALAEAQAAQRPDGNGATRDVVDLRDRPWSSIDNPTSRDLDQIEWAERLGSGRARLFVGIADVDALAAAGGAIDQHAGHNTTSVYTGVVTFPMIPEQLSSHLTSLHEGEDRLAVVVEMVIDESGSITDVGARRALVQNRARLAYGEVGAWLTGNGGAPGKLATDPALAEQLRLQREISAWLRTRRRADGALELETSEVRTVATDGRVVGLEQTVRNAARDLIEDIMLATNTAIAGLCETAGVSWIRRIVRSPERWDRIVALAASLGATLPASPSGTALAQFLLSQRVSDPDHFPELSLALLKLIGKGEYAVERRGEDLEGHFGLAIGDYSHSTAPNRRYADLVTQRLLKAIIAGRPAPYADEALDAIALRCTEREDEAKRVERKLSKLAAAAFIAPRVGESFDAVVTGVSGKGTFARVFHPPVEGRVVRGEAGWDVGDRVRVRLLAADPETGYIDFAATGGVRVPDVGSARTGKSTTR